LNFGLYFGVPVESAKTFDTIFMRLLTATESKSESDFARSIGITPQSVNGARKRGKVPPDWVQSVAEKTGISSDWLFFGRGPMRIGNAQPTAPGPGKINPIPEGEPQWMSAKDAAEKGYGLIPKVRARLSAGTGSLETTDSVIGLYAFKMEFLIRKGHPNRMVLMDVVGDSMEPDIWPGDTVLIDESQREIIAGGMFAVGIEQEVYVKYLHRIPGKLVLRSKNPEYDPIEVDMNGEISNSVRIIGRVVWSCREYVR
jgi:phage repressor protein C with HTH and peptisase S24 domain